MNLRDLEYLLALTETGHFGKAAAKTNVSQPTLSMQLKKLETELGVRLIERGHNVMLTPVGKQVAAQARQMLAGAAHIRELARLAHDPMAGEFTLGAFPTLAPYILPLLMKPLGRAFPKLTLRLVEEKTDTLLAELEQGSLDAALIALPVRPQHIQSVALFSEPFLLAVPKNHELASRKRIKLSELKTHELLLLDDGHCLREQALDVCHKIGASESQNFRATSLETLRHMVAAGSAMTLMPKFAATDDRQIAYIPLVDPVPARSIGLCWRSSSPRSALLRKMAEVMKKTMAS